MTISPKPSFSLTISRDKRVEWKIGKTEGADFALYNLLNANDVDAYADEGAVQALVADDWIGLAVILAIASSTDNQTQEPVGFRQSDGIPVEQMLAALTTLSRANLVDLTQDGILLTPKGRNAVAASSMLIATQG